MIKESKTATKAAVLLNLIENMVLSENNISKNLSFETKESKEEINIR